MLIPHYLKNLVTLNIDLNCYILKIIRRHTCTFDKSTMSCLCIFCYLQERANMKCILMFKYDISQLILFNLPWTLSLAYALWQHQSTSLNKIILGGKLDLSPKKKVLWKKMRSQLIWKCRDEVTFSYIHICLSFKQGISLSFKPMHYLSVWLNTQDKKARKQCLAFPSFTFEKRKLDRSSKLAYIASPVATMKRNKS